MAEFVLELDADWGWDGKYLVGLTLSGRRHLGSGN